MKRSKGNDKTIFLCTAPCTAKLKSRIVANLKSAAQDRFNQDNAKKARALLAAINNADNGSPKSTGRGR